MRCVGVPLDNESAEDDCYNLSLSLKEEGAQLLTQQAEDSSCPARRKNPQVLQERLFSSLRRKARRCLHSSPSRSSSGPGDLPDPLREPLIIPLASPAPAGEEGV